MAYKIHFLDIAIQELDDAKEYYEYQQSNLGIKFIKAIKNSVELIENYPLAWHPLSTKTRRCLVKNFPYAIIYQIRESEILITAISNLHRKPNYWIERIIKD